jgi:predicted glycosyltransferase
VTPPEARASEHPRIAIFTHDAYGLGHVRRCVHLVHGLAARAPQAPILFITGAPAVEMLRSLPPNADYVKIPTIVTSGVQGAMPPVLGIGLAELSLLRSRTIRELVRSFAPDVFLVDNFPLGSRLELLPTLKALRPLGTRIVLGLRDVADPPERVRADWARDGIYHVLERYYDRILIYGMREVLDAAEAYALPPAVAAKVRYCGYVTACDAPARAPEELRAEIGLPSPLLLATVGGGGDGFPLLSSVLEALPRVPQASALVVTGEFMPPAEREKLRALAAGRPRVVVRDYLPDLPAYMGAADLVIAMGGYNTAAEILASGCRALLVPRTWRPGEQAGRARSRMDGEQLVRAQLLSALGLAELLPPDQLGPEALAERIGAALERPRPVTNGGARVNVQGIESVVDHLLALARGEENA